MKYPKDTRIFLDFVHFVHYLSDLCISLFTNDNKNMGFETIYDKEINLQYKGIQLDFQLCQILKGNENRIRFF